MALVALRNSTEVTCGSASVATLETRARVLIAEGYQHTHTVVLFSKLAQNRRSRATRMNVGEGPNLNTCVHSMQG